MPDEKVAAHRLASLMEGLWPNHETERAMVDSGVDPKLIHDAIIEWLTIRATNALKPS